MTLETIQAGLLGLAVGDALGVPVEFRPRAALDAAPVTGMRAYGTHSQPAGTWSDDTSMALCVLETLAERGALEGAAMVENCGMEKQRVYPRFADAPEDSGYFSLVVVKRNGN